MQQLRSSNDPKDIAKDIATLAYIWGYPLVTAQVAESYVTNPNVPQGVGYGPANQFNPARNLINAINGNDNQTINQINNHVLDIQKEFSQGNFTKPFFIHEQQVPGSKIMSEKKDLIQYNISQMNNGSSLFTYYEW